MLRLIIHKITLRRYQDYSTKHKHWDIFFFISKASVIFRLLLYVDEPIIVVYSAGMLWILVVFPVGLNES